MMKLTSQKFAASRFLLPTEMFLGICSVAWGLSGGMLGGHLFNVLSSRGENLSWLLVLCFVGGAQFFAAFYEWFFGFSWMDRSDSFFKMTVHRSVFIRKWGAFISGAMWIYVLSTLIDADGTRSIGSLWVMSPASIIFEMWAYYENQKVYCALDPEYETTSTLSFRR